jgi:Skp family chaperone for outer membrane proteins
MRMLSKLFVAFCVGTVLAQTLILAMAAVRGNLNKTSLLKAVALLNGVDITGDRLQKMLEENKQSPNPTYEDVEAERASQSKSLDMRERSILQYKRQVEELLAEHKQVIADFDRRKNEFYRYLETAEKDLANESLKEVQRTIETLSPEMAKNQIKKFLEDGQMEDVVAIVKGMPLDKRKKILGEFTTDEEITKLNEILTTLRQGDLKAGLIENAREQMAIE